MTAAEADALPALRPRAIVGRVLGWYADHARDLPWRRPGTSPWAVMVSEFMLQQTPVERVRGPWAAWLDRWPTPEALAAAPAGEAVRAWGRLGYPRRALRLHQAAVAITERFDGQVPGRPGGPAQPAWRRLLHRGGDHAASRTGGARSCWTPTSGG